MTRPARICLSSGQEQRLRAWKEALRTARCQIVGDDGDVADEIDVLVIDRPLSDAHLSFDEQRLSSGQTGMIAVGIGLPADVSLPADHSPRELRLACLLLSEIVRLRRQREASRRQEKVLRHLALSDPLTGLPNRRAWDQQLAERLSGAGQGEWCVALLDVDQLHDLNDQRGLLEGDACLRRIADRLTGLVRRGDFVARLGGDEFGVLLEGLNAERAGAQVDLIRAQAGEDGNDAKGFPPLQLTAGWAALTAPASRTAVQEALGHADEALRKAKRAGRNRTQSA
ncbi:MAG TPA: GGDEF domain-containing protein [Pirellulaceae bacterium]|nr:GGDEF domain-containing protein [Pirellulaceae bacterium]